MDSLVPFMQSATGRGLRIVLGLGLIVGGLAGIHGIGGWVLAAVGLIPLAAGGAGVCLFAPLVGYTFRGRHRTA